MNKYMKFVTNNEINKWTENHIAQGCTSRSAYGEQFMYEFLPSGKVEYQIVKCLCCGESFEIMKMNIKEK